MKDRTKEYGYLVRQRHTFLHHGKEFDAYDLSVNDFLLMQIDPMGCFRKITSECNDKIPELNARQLENFFKKISGNSQEQYDDLLNNIWNIKKKLKQVDNFLCDFEFLEHTVSKISGQSVRDIRERNIQYFLRFLKDFEYHSGKEKYTKLRYSHMTEEQKNDAWLQKLKSIL